jgi:hypothetical protein
VLRGLGDPEAPQASPIRPTARANPLPRNDPSERTSWSPKMGKSTKAERKTASSASWLLPSTNPKIVTNSNNKGNTATNAI